MIRLLLVRHGQTGWNTGRQYQGHADIPLDDRGNWQKEALAQALSGETIDALYASDLERAYQTAKAVARFHPLTVVRDARLREIGFGDWEGLTYEQALERWPDRLTAWFDDPLQVAPPNGETLSQLADRIQAFLQNVRQTHADQTVVLVSHGGPLRVMLCLLMGIDVHEHWQFGLDVASISEIRIWDQQCRLVRFNDTHHLSNYEEDRMGKLVLVLGGAKSGKSTFAQNSAFEIGGQDVLFVATAQALDAEMQERIQRHRDERPQGWRTLEAPRRVGHAIQESVDGARVVLVDCLTLLVSNLLLDYEDPFAAKAEETILAEIQDLIHCTRQLQGTVIVVSNEVGTGLVPPYPLGRAYRDLLGKANQIIAREADQVYLLVAGLPVEVKGLSEKSAS